MHTTINVKHFYNLKELEIEISRLSHFIFILDTDSIRLEETLPKILTFSVLSNCEFFIATGKKAEETENLVDDFLIEHEKLFFPTTIETVLNELKYLIHGWHINKEKTVVILSENKDFSSLIHLEEKEK